MGASSGSGISTATTSPREAKMVPHRRWSKLPRDRCPTPISQIPKVEKLNNLAINVFGLDKDVTVYRLNTQPDGMPRINLLLIEKAGKFRYTWIRDYNRLLRDQTSTRTASTSASAACTATQGRICWKPTDPTVVG